MKPVLGILGGMGALASAEFVKTLYESNMDCVEQELPIVILYSDPTFPDRTDAFLNEETEAIVGQLTDRLEQLYDMNVSKVVLCCVTLHYVLPRIPERLRNRVISLIDVALDQVIESGCRQLLLCSSGARASRVFQKHEKWPLAAKYITLPDLGDQERIHRALYKYKVDPDAQPLLHHLKGLLAKYHTDSFVAGCSELHMMTRRLIRESGDQYSFIDPLLTIATTLRGRLADRPPIPAEVIYAEPASVRADNPVMRKGA